MLTVEEGCLPGGFGSAVLEAANDAGLPPRTSEGLAFRTDSSSTPSATNSLPRSVSTSTASSRAALEIARAVGLEFSDLGPESELDATHSTGPIRTAGLCGRPSPSDRRPTRKIVVASRRRNASRPGASDSYGNVFLAGTSSPQTVIPRFGS